MDVESLLGRTTAAAYGAVLFRRLNRRIPDRETLQREIAYRERRRNAAQARVEWMLDVRRVREKPGRVHPSPLPAILPMSPEPVSAGRDTPSEFGATMPTSPEPVTTTVQRY